MLVRAIVPTIYLCSSRDSAGTSALKVRDRSSLYISLRYWRCFNRATLRGSVPDSLLDPFCLIWFFQPDRTGKRDLGGLLNDGINSLARSLTRSVRLLSFCSSLRPQDVHLNIQRLVLSGCHRLHAWFPNSFSLFRVLVEVAIDWSARTHPTVEHPSRSHSDLRLARLGRRGDVIIRMDSVFSDYA